MIFYKFRKKLKKDVNKVFKLIFFIKSFKKYDVIFYDDIFPHPISGFRYEEYTELLKQFNKSKIIMNPTAYSLVDSKLDNHIDHITKYKQKYPEVKNQLKLYKGFININTKLFYCIFLNNIYSNLDWLEKYKVPFVFTLYPGGGFQIEDEESDRKLQKVLISSQFKKVLVTQNYTKEYLIKKDFCSFEKIEYVFGGVVPQISLEREKVVKKFYPEKKTLDIVFCGAKYMPKGLDKGYDVFIEFAHKIHVKYDFIRFHIIGGFDENEIDVSLLGDSIVFYGYQKFEDLANIFEGIDIIISPNKPFFLNRGAFDGFPLGTVVEAVFNGVVAIVTDNLNQNTIFKNNEEIIIIESNVESIEKEVINLISTPGKLIELSEKGRFKFKEVYSKDIQVITRVELLKREIY